jgi:hypothetical protein
LSTRGPQEFNQVTAVAHVAAADAVAFAPEDRE